MEGGNTRTRLVHLLQQKKLKLLGQQTEAVTEFLDSKCDGDRSKVDVLRTIVEWSATAINVDPRVPQYWQIFRRGANELCKYENWGLINSRSCFLVVNAIKTLCSDGKQDGRRWCKDAVFLTELNESLWYTMRRFGYKPAIDLVSDLFASAMDVLVRERDDSNASAMEGLVTTITECLSESSAVLSPRKMFDLTMKKLLDGLFSIRFEWFGKQEIATSRNLLMALPSFVDGHENDEGREAAMMMDGKEKPKVVLLVERLLIRSLFHQEILDQFEQGCVAWKMWMNEDKKTDLKFTSFVRVLFQRLSDLYDAHKKHNRTETICANLAWLYETFLSRCKDTVHAQVDEMVEPSPKKRKTSDSVSSLSLQFKVFIEFLELCGKWSCKPGSMAKAFLLRVFIDNDVYDVSKETHGKLFSIWLDRLIDETWKPAVGPVCVVSLVLEMDHRLMQPKLEIIIPNSFEGRDQLTGDQNACLSFAPHTELCLRLLDTYSRLRQMGSYVSFFVQGMRKHPNHVLKELSDPEQVLSQGFAFYFRKIPQGQIGFVWNVFQQLLLDCLEQQQETTAPSVLLPLASLFEVYTANIPVEDGNAKEIVTLALRMLNEMGDTSKLGFNNALGLGKGMIIQAISALLGLCDKFLLTIHVEMNKPRAEWQPSHIIDVRAIVAGMGTHEELSEPLHKRLAATCLGRLAALTLNQQKMMMVHEQALDKKITKKLVKVITSLGHDQVMTHLFSICTHAKSKTLDKMTADILSEPFAEKSMLRNSLFYELHPIRNRFGEVVCTLIEQHATTNDVSSLDLVLQTVAAFPVGYLAEEAAGMIYKQLVKSDWKLLENQDGGKGIFRVLEVISRQFPQVIDCDVLKALGKVSSTDDAVDKCAFALGRAISRNDEVMKKLDKKRRWQDFEILQQDFRPCSRQFLLGLIGGLKPSNKSVPSFVLNNQPKLDEPEICVAMTKLLARRVAKNSSQEGESEVLEKCRETIFEIDFQNQSSPVLAAICGSIRFIVTEKDAAWFQNFARFVIFSSTSNESFAKSLFTTCCKKTQLPVLHEMLVTEIKGKLLESGTSLSSSSSSSLWQESDFTSIAVFWVVLPITFGHDKKLLQHGERLVPLFLQLSSLEFNPRRLESLQVVNFLLTRCPELWDTRKLQQIRQLMMSMNAILQFTQVQKDPDVLNALSDIQFALMKLFGFWIARKCAAIVVGSLQACHAAILAVQVNGFDKRLVEAMEMLSRACAEVVPHKKIYRHHAAYWLSNYISNINKIPMTHRKMRDLYERAAFYWLDVCSKHEIQQLHAAFDETQQSLLQTLREKYERNHKYRGEV